MKKISRKNKLIYTTATSVLLQLVSVISGFILPRLYLTYWGSEVNGLVASIGQFLGLISFLDLGVGQVVQSCLYSPLANEEFHDVSMVLSSGMIFFRKLALIFLIYTGGLAIAYPLFINSNFGYWYVASLIIILSIDSFAQYYFGIAYQMLLNSDQKGYIPNFVQCITIVLNVSLSVVFLRLGFSLHAVKLTTSIVFLLRPFLMWLYIKRCYPSVCFNVKYEKDPIKQKWDGFAQHVANVVLTNTDVVVLTLFSTLTNVSIYSVYNMVVIGVKRLLMSFTNGVQAVFGDLWARKDIEKLKDFFYDSEWTIHTLTTIAFGCTASLIIPFVEVYTLGINDANYIIPSFGLLITAAHALHCYRLPYNMMTISSGHFRQTQICYIGASLINIIVSVITVWKYGLIGVAVGTLVAMAFQTIWLAIYLKNHLFKMDLSNFIKQILVDAGTILICFFFTNVFVLKEKTYFSWFVLAVEKGIVWTLGSCIINCLIYPKRVKSFINRFRK